MNSEHFVTSWNVPSVPFSSPTFFEPSLSTYLHIVDHEEFGLLLRKKLKRLKKLKQIKSYQLKNH